MSAQVAAERVFNFSPGPAVLPLPVLKRVQEDLLCLPGAGCSILEVSHRSEEYIAIQNQAQASLRRLLGIGDEFEVLFLQGGARLQFSMTAVNLLRGQSTAAQYVLTGSWGKYAADEARKEGAVEVIYDAKATNYDRLPDAGELKISPDAAYVHITSNETIQGVQFLDDIHASGAPLVCDSSSDFLCRPVNLDRYSLIYACAQKNAGPAGVTVVVIRKELLERSANNLPGYLSYRNHASEGSMWNTPPTFAIYVLGLIGQWLEETIGGLDSMLNHNRKKARLLYSKLDAYPELFIGHAQPDSRSLMNVTFRFPSPGLEKEFLTT
ncbi:MAG: 3-phosphoserine/phosphohydroxythreonine transaminase, partial [Pirellulaceae bacterium]|nr:3-phosphoserine/phosphohydroxythreonine transaminase [Pirellulaceae bacterium]